MANRVDSMLAGCGPVRATLSVLIEQCPTDTVLNESLAALTNALEVVWHEPIRKQAALAVVAAFMNQDFLESGYLYRADKDGRLRTEYIVTGNSREVIASLMSE